MNEERFKEILDKIDSFGIYPPRFFNSEDLKIMTSNQLIELTVKMMRFTGVGSYTLRADLYDLIEYLDVIVSIPEDPNLEKYLHMTASLICLAWFQGFDFKNVKILPQELSRHLEQVIGPHPRITHPDETEPSLQIATFLAYPLLEGVIRRKLPEYISKEGSILREFHVPSRKTPYKPGDRISNINHGLQLLIKESKNPSFTEKLSYLNETYLGGIRDIHSWRAQLLHGALTASWHSITLLLLTYIILLESRDVTDFASARAH